MNLKPEDILDDKVREWYIKKNTSTGDGVIVHIPIADIDDAYFYKAYTEGYKQYISNGEHLRENNPYWQFILSLRNSVTPSDFHALSLDVAKKKSTDRFKVMEDIFKNGYDESKPITLWVSKFRTTNIRTVKSVEGQLVSFNGYDGHHRLAAAKKLGMKYIPAIIGKPRFLPLTSLERMSTKNKWNWYQPINFEAETEIHFDHKESNLHGARKYDFILREALQPIKEHTFIDIGCNTGVITACIAADYAKYSIGIDYDRKIEQAIWVKRTLWADYGNLIFRGVHLRNDLSKFQQILEQIKTVDCMLMSNFIYYMGDKTDDLLEICGNFADKIVLQGNKLKPKPHQHYRGEYSQIKGMKELLEKHGYNTRIIAPHAYPKPIVVGTKGRKNAMAPEVIDPQIADRQKLVQNIIFNLAASSEYWKTAKKRFVVSIEHLAQSIKYQPVNLKILNVGGIDEEEEIFRTVFGENISYESLNHLSPFNAKIDEIPFENNTFDVVICWETIEHLWTIREDGILNAEGILHCWKEMGRVLKPEGIFHLTTTNRFCPRTFAYMTPLTLPQINAFNFTQMDATIWGHARELSAAELMKIAQHTNIFTSFIVSSHHCYDDTQPETKKYKEWSKKLEQHIQRPLKQEEKYDTLFFVHNPLRQPLFRNG